MSRITTILRYNHRRRCCRRVVVVIIIIVVVVIYFASKCKDDRNKSIAIIYKRPLIDTKNRQHSNTHKHKNRITFMFTLATVIALYRLSRP